MLTDFLDDAKIGRILLQICKPSAAVYATYIEIPLHETAVTFYHAKAMKYFDEGGSEGF